MIYLIVAVIVLLGVCFLLGKALAGKSQKLRAAEAEVKAVKENVERVLDYERQDDLLVTQREAHVQAITKTRSKEKVDEEVKTLMSNLRDAYNSL